VHAKPSDCLHEISISKTVGHQFWPGLMARAEIWGHREKRMQLRGRPYFMLGGGRWCRGRGLYHSTFCRLKQRFPYYLEIHANVGHSEAQKFGPGPSNAGLLVDFYAPWCPEMVELSFLFSLIATEDHRWPSH